MTDKRDDTTRDSFLNGAITVLQPQKGYRAATDPVFLAACIPAKAGQSVLEIGCGVGVAMLCLEKRVPGLLITGLELQEYYAELAQQNIVLNASAARLVQGDLMRMPADISGTSYDHVLFNPPFYGAKNVSAPKDAGKSLAYVMELGIKEWIEVGLKRLKPKGRISFIHRTEVLPEALSCLNRVAGDIKIKPLASRTDHAAKRVLITARKGTKGPTSLLAPLIIHKSEDHLADVGAYSTIAQAILREGHALIL